MIKETIDVIDALISTELNLIGLVEDAHAAHAKQIFVNGEDEKGKKEKYKDGSYKKEQSETGFRIPIRFLPAMMT